MNPAFILNGLLFGAAVWVGLACVKRLNLMQWRSHDAVVILAYIAIAVWSASYVLGIPEVQPLGIVAVALLFFAGRRRWLTAAPPETLIGPEAESKG